MKNNKLHAFIFDLGKGGAQGVFVTLVNYLTQCGYDIEVVVQTLNNEVHLNKIDKRIKIYNLNEPSAKKVLPKLCKYFKDEEVEKAIVFNPELAVNIYFVKRFLRCNTVIVARNINTLSVEFKNTSSLFRKYITKHLIKYVYKRLDYIVAQSQGMADDLINEFNVPARIVTVINNPLGEQYENELREQPELNRDNYILYVGRLEKQKGLEMLISAFCNLDNKDMKLIILGSGSLKDSILNIINTKKMKHRIEILDYTNNTIEFYKKAKLTVLTSLYEGFPNVLIESISCGTPVVSFDMPSGARDIIDDSNGILVDYLDVNKMTLAMQEGIKKRWDYNLIKSSAEKYRINVIMSQYVKLIEEI